MKFEASIFNKIWSSSEGRDVVTKVLQNPDLIHANHTFAFTKFKVDPKITPTNEEGEASFISKMRMVDNGTLMDVRAPLGDSVPEDKKGLEYYSGTIPEFISRGTVEKATERDYKRQLFEQFGDARLVAQYAADVLQPKLDSANQTLSNMAAQVLSTGKIDYMHGLGANIPVLKAKIPEANFTTCGEKVWTDPTAKILDQMVAIQEKFQDMWGTNMPLQWEIPLDMFKSCFLQNNQVMEWYRYFQSVDNRLVPEKLVLDKDMVMSVISRYADLAPVSIIEEKQNDNSVVVHGWDAKAAVLRPAGYAGLIRHTSTDDERLFKAEYTNPANTYSFAPALMGLAIVRNSTIVNGNFKEWHTDLILPAVPTLDEFLYHVIVDTTEADA